MKPFEDELLSDYLTKRSILVKEYIEKWVNNDEIMSNDINLLANNIYEQHYIIPIVLDEEDVSRRMVKQKKVRKYVAPIFRDYTEREYVDVDGVCASFYFPYSGDRELFKCRASIFPTVIYPEICIDDDYIIINLELSLSELDGSDAKQKSQQLRESLLNDIIGGILNVNKGVETFNSSLRKSIKEQLQDKKDKVSAYYNIAKIFEVPIEKTEYAKTHITVTRNITPISHKYNSEDVYRISDNDYNDILSSIKHTATTYERTPSSYKYMQEEDLRNTLLAALNGSYNGTASGETFRRQGKTDICIEMGNRAAFVAECKMWTGSKGLCTAIEQLDNYLTWRDCKTALIIFVRKRNFVDILNKSKLALQNISFMRRVKEIDKNEFECQYASKSNQGQIIQLRVMLFNVYCDEPKN